MELKPLYLFVVAFIVITVGLVTLQVASSNIEKTDLLQNTSSSNFTYTVPTTLTAEETISSFVVERNNQTWLEFDGVNNKIIQSSFGTDNRTNLSMFVFIKPKTYNATYQYQVIFRNTDKKFSLRLNNATGNLVFDSTYLSDTSIGADYSPALNEWESVGFTYNGSIKRIYAKANLYGTESSTGNLTFGNGAVWYGADDGPRPLNGSIDDIIIYDNCAITPYDVANIYVNNSRINNFIIPNFMVHQIGNSASSLVIQEAKFIEFLNMLNNSGYESITDIDYYNWTQGKFTMPKKPFMMVWDDGINNTMRGAELMEPYGYSAMVAVTTSLLDSGLTYLGNAYMNWSNISTLINDYNWSVLSHSESHCSMTGESGTTNCTSTINRQGNLSQSKQDIIDNLGITPISFIYPYNDWNITTMEDCLLNYTYCHSSETNIATTIKYMLGNNINVTNGDMIRISLDNLTTLTALNESLNSAGCEVSYQLKLNENTGTTAYDSSGNSNDGTINGATWDNDGILLTLTDVVDYTIDKSSGLFTIVNTDYLYDWVNVDWSYNYRTIQRNVEIARLTKIFIAISILAFLFLIINFYRNNFK